MHRDINAFMHTYRRFSDISISLCIFARHGIHKIIQWIKYLNALKDVLKGSWNDPSLGCGLIHPLHGERLTTSRLTIGKNCTIVPLSDTLQRGKNVTFGSD